MRLQVPGNRLITGHTQSVHVAPIGVFCDCARAPLFCQGAGLLFAYSFRRIMRLTPIFLAIWIALLGAWPVFAADQNDYPTAVRAEYVFACMASVGQTQDALRRCSCSIDTIASLLPFDSYQKAETVLRMRRSAGGYLGEVFRSSLSNAMVRDLQEAEAEAEIRCF